MSESLLTAEQVAELLCVPRSWVYEQSRAGRIPTVTLGRYRRYRREAIETWRRGRRRVAILLDGRSSHGSLTRIKKAAKDFLTEGDLASEAALKHALNATTPDLGVFGEEGGGDALDHGRVWVADPLDGTINYAAGPPLCGVMLALMDEGDRSSA